MALKPARITLGYAIEQRDNWFKALEAAASGQSYSIGGRTLTRQNIGDINAQLGYWINAVKTLELRQRGIKRKMHARAWFATPGAPDGGGAVYGLGWDTGLREQ